MNARNSNRRLGVAALIALPLVLVTSLATLAAAGDAPTQATQISEDAATLFRSARAVISKNQGLINDAAKADKGLGAEVVISAAKKNYATATGQPFPDSDDASLAGESRQAMIDAIRTVMEQAQPLINEPGKAFKGFLPAVFAKQVADQFSKNMNGKMTIKLTAPKAYVRNRANRPDSWEHKVIEEQFKDNSWETGKPFFENAQVKGQSAFRFILPEYYKDSCLKCHGQPAGQLDITGGKKEGGVLGELGGAISVTILDSALMASAEE